MEPRCFGQPLDGLERVDTPVGESCPRCARDIEAGDDGFVDDGAWHRLCYLEETLGPFEAAYALHAL